MAYEVEMAKDKNMVQFVVKTIETEKVRRFTIDLQQMQFYGVSKTKPLIMIPTEYRHFDYNVVCITYAEPSLESLWRIITAVCKRNNSLQCLVLAEKWINVGIQITDYNNDSWMEIPFTKENIRFFKEKNNGILDYEKFMLGDKTEELEKLTETYPYDSGSRYSDINVLHWYKTEVLLNQSGYPSWVSVPEVKKWTYKQLIAGMGYIPNYSSLFANYLELYRRVYQDDYSHLSKDIFTHTVTLRKHLLSAKYLNCDEKLATRYNPLVIPELENNTIFTIITPKTVEDFRNESQQQGNCVLTHYCKKVADGETNIYFIRKKDNPQKSFITMEIRNGHIESLLGKGNHRINPDIENQLVAIIKNHLKKQK